MSLTSILRSSATAEDGPTLSPLVPRGERGKISGGYVEMRLPGNAQAPGRPVLHSGRDLFSRGEVGAALRAGEHLVRIAAVFRIEHTTQGAHRFEIVLRKLLLHEINFLHADPVFSRYAPPQFDALLQNIVPGCQRPTDLVGIAFVIQHQRMDIAVAGVKDVGNS